VVEGLFGNILFTLTFKEVAIIYYVKSDMDSNRTNNVKHN